ncbi:hypothetical protein FH972_025397 [Carpinus fangiana]|uniref:Uncharacterized protein n=1 Tax=Carpinus fangiana TaxID=176857 RepID=A0A5N6L1A8_9ROSI|nr:hypothetical protein FH972_025397 [Carpinus fangiana]
MDKRRPRKQAKTRRSTSEEVSSIEWEFIKMTDQEEDLIYRMYRLVGDRAAKLKAKPQQEIPKKHTAQGKADQQQETSKGGPLANHLTQQEENYLS